MRLIRVGICVLLAFAVLAYGAVESWARAILETAAGLLFVLWVFDVLRGRRPAISISPVLPPLAAFTAVALCQWSFHLTAARYVTRTEVQLLLADVILVFLFTQVFRSFDDWKSFVWFLMIFSFGVAVFGLLQHFTFNGKLYWFRELRFGGAPFGPYVNRNHYAAFAELTIPIALVPLILGKVRRERMALVILFTVVCVGALLFSVSRGGIISFGCELMFLAIWLAAKRAVRPQALVGVAAVSLALLMVSWLGARQVLQRLSTIHASEVTGSKRTAMAVDTYHIFRDHPVWGTGLGTLQIVFPRYETDYDGKVVNHSHNDYLEALAETGLLGGLCCAWFICTLLVLAYKRLLRAQVGRTAAFRLAAFLGCFGVLIHSFVDFNLHIPANALLFFLLSALVVSPPSVGTDFPVSHARAEAVSTGENAD